MEIPPGEYKQMNTDTTDSKDTLTTADNISESDTDIEDDSVPATKDKTVKIYLLTNKINGKVYVGQTWLSFKKRIRREGQGYKNSFYLYAAIQKHGVSNFEYTVLAETIDQDEANKLENDFIIKYDSRNLEKGYNLKEGGWGGRHSEETKAKISESLSGKERTEEHCRNLSEATKGVPKGPHTEEWKKENSERTKQWHAENEHPFAGKHHTEEAKQAMREKMAGKPRSPESIEKGRKALMAPQEEQDVIVKEYLSGKTIKEICKLLKVSPGKIYRTLKANNIDKTGNFSKWTGKTHSEETKEKMSKSREDYWEKKK